MAVPLPYWLCSTQQILLVVTCLGIALLFTAFDQEPTKRKLMANVWHLNILEMIILFSAPLR